MALEFRSVMSWLKNYMKRAADQGDKKAEERFEILDVTSYQSSR